MATDATTEQESSMMLQAQEEYLRAFLCDYHQGDPALVDRLRAWPCSSQREADDHWALYEQCVDNVPYLRTCAQHLLEIQPILDEMRLYEQQDGVEPNKPFPAKAEKRFKEVQAQLQPWLVMQVPMRQSEREEFENESTRKIKAWLEQRREPPTHVATRNSTLQAQQQDAALQGMMSGFRDLGRARARCKSAGTPLGGQAERPLHILRETCRVYLSRQKSRHEKISSSQTKQNGDEKTAPTATQEGSSSHCTSEQEQEEDHPALVDKQANQEHMGDSHLTVQQSDHSGDGWKRQTDSSQPLSCNKRTRRL